jgi:hypothetical protein
VGHVLAAQLAADGRPDQRDLVRLGDRLGACDDRCCADECVADERLDGDRAAMSRSWMSERAVSG